MPLTVDFVKETEKRYLIIKDGALRGDICFNDGKWYVNIIKVPKLAFNHNSLHRCFGYAQGVFAAAFIIGVEMYGEPTITRN
jgi:hypothetical protein